jgi:hypothetical protein
MLGNEAQQRGFGDFFEGGWPSLQIANDFSLQNQQSSLHLCFHCVCVCVCVCGGEYDEVNRPSSSSSSLYAVTVNDLW